MTTTATTKTTPAELQLDEGHGHHLGAGTVINTTATVGVATGNGGDPG